jgi:hypothetical protein
MKKLSLILGAIALVLIAMLMMGCEQPTDGTNGSNGTDGWTPAASLTAAKTLLDAGASQVYLTTSDTETSVVTITKGKLWIPIAATLGGSGGGLTVDGTAEVIIDAAATLADGDLIVKKGAKLTVGAEGGIVAASGKLFIVEDGANVTVNGTFTGGAIGDATTAGAYFLAKTLGNQTKTGGTYTPYTDQDELGEIKLGSTAVLVTAIADIDNAWDTGVKAVKVSDAVVGTASLGTNNKIASGAKVILGNSANTLTGGLVIPTNIATLTIPSGSTLTVSGASKMLTVGNGQEVVVGGTLAITAHADPAITLAGTGKITAGGIVVSGAGTVKSATAGSTLIPNSFAPADTAVVTLAGSQIQAGGANGITFKPGAYTFGGTNTVTTAAGAKPTLTLGTSLIIGDTVASELVFGSNSVYLGDDSNAITPGTTANARTDVKLTFKKDAVIKAGTGASNGTSKGLTTGGLVSADNTSYKVAADTTVTKAATASTWSGTVDAAAGS